MSFNHSALAGACLNVPDWHSAAKLIDHTLLKADTTRNRVEMLCKEALLYEFHAVMVNPAWVSVAVARLRDSNIKVGTVAGFPLGASLTGVKMAEAEAAFRNGAHEVDFVMNIGALKSGGRTSVQTEMCNLARLAHKRNAVVKVILENSLLTQEEKILACSLALDSGVDFVKTSTGFATSGATVADVVLMRGVVGMKVGVKAAGGIRTAAQFMDMVDAGANRIGCSASVELVRELGAPSSTT